MKVASQVAYEADLAPSRTSGSVEYYDLCNHKHKLTGTAVFYQSLGVLQCNECRGYQAIKKPLD